MPLRRRTRVTVAILAVVALASLSGVVALYWTLYLGRFMRQAIGEHHSGAEAARLQQALDQRIALAAWVDAASLAVVAMLGTVLIWWLFYVGLRRIRSQLFQAERLALAGKLAASMAHEIRSPLTAMKMWLFAIRTAAGPDAELQRKFDIVAEEMTRLENMVLAFLEFSRPRERTTEGRRPFLLLSEFTSTPERRYRAQCISAIIDKTWNLACHQVRHKRIRFLCDNRAGLPPVLADPQQLQQVFLNLLNNAVEATPEGGEIRFQAVLEELRGAGERVVVRVQDTGPGIPQEVRARLFEPFTTTKETGTGLGLYIASQIMARLGGKLVLESSTAAGTSFAVWIPLAPPESQ